MLRAFSITRGGEAPDFELLFDGGLYDIWIGTIGRDTCNARLILETF